MNITKQSTIDERYDRWPISLNCEQVEPKMTDCPQDHQPPPGTGAPFATFPFPFTLSFPFSHTWQEQDNSSPFYPLSYTSIHLLYDLSFTLPKTCQLLLFVFAKTKWNLTSCHVHHKSIPEHLASYFSTLWWLLHRKPWLLPAPCTRSGKRPKISSLMVITDMDKENLQFDYLTFMNAHSFRQSDLCMFNRCQFILNFLSGIKDRILDSM